MKDQEKELTEQEGAQEPQVYAVSKGKDGAWKFSRRDFLALAGGALATLVAGATSGCTGAIPPQPKASPTPSPTLPPTPTQAPTSTPTPTRPPTSTPPPTRAATSTPTPTPLLPRASYVADVSIPDGTVMTPGQSFTKTWRLTNSGAINWGAGTRLVFSRGTQMGGASPISVPNASPGETVDISVNMTAPSSPGEYTGYWTLIAGDGTSMITVYVKIVVQSIGQPGEVPPGQTGINMTGPSGETRHLPCGSPIPAGWTCVCNCVTVPAPCSCDGVCSCVGYTSCTCDTIHYWYPN